MPAHLARAISSGAVLFKKGTPERRAFVEPLWSCRDWFLKRALGQHLGVPVGVRQPPLQVIAKSRRGASPRGDTE